MDNGMKASATYALWGNRLGEDCTLFLGNGTLLQTPSASVKADVPVNVLLEKEADGWYYTASGTCTVTLGGKTYKIRRCAKKTKL